MANPSVKEKWASYNVNGRTSAELLSQMKQRGPNGFWAYTNWYVRWSANCKVDVEISYTMPKHTNPGSMPADVKARWDRMNAALAAHERKHGQHGINAARELVATSCKNGNAVIAKWAEQDKVLDKRTRHGETEGVVFP
ncbi:MAG: DUF922 domain-containing protein [Roseovarius sp.]